MHALDLPNLRYEPSKTELFNTLKKFELKSLKNFESSNEPVDQMGLFNWLTKVVGSDLSWLSEDEDREVIWDMAGKRMAERCGRTAMPDMTREFDVEGMAEPVVLDEPALTEDNLGLKTWGSSLILAARLVREPELMNGKMLELGSGTGLTAVVAARLGADIIATDLPAIVPNLQSNLTKNHTLAVAEELDWNDPSAFNNTHGQFDTIMVADPIYSFDHPPLVSKTIAALLKHTPTARLVLQLPQRQKYQDVRDLLYSELKSIGLLRERFEVETGDDEFGQTEYAWSLWRF